MVVDGQSVLGYFSKGLFCPTEGVVLTAEQVMYVAMAMRGKPTKVTSNKPRRRRKRQRRRSPRLMRFLRDFEATDFIQNDLCKQSGLSSGVVSFIMTGKTLNPEAATLTKLEAALSSLKAQQLVAERRDNDTSNSSSDGGTNITNSL